MRLLKPGETYTSSIAILLRVETKLDFDNCYLIILDKSDKVTEHYFRSQGYLDRDVFNWCHENIGVCQHSWDVIQSKWPDGIVVIFEEEEGALKFILRWCG